MFLFVVNIIHLDWVYPLVDVFAPPSGPSGHSESGTLPPSLLELTVASSWWGEATVPALGARSGSWSQCQGQCGL